MRRLRTKLILLFSLAALLPALPLALLVQDLMRKSLNVGVNPQVSSALQGAFELYKNSYAQIRKELSTTATAWRPESDPERFLNDHNLDLMEMFAKNGDTLLRLSRSDTITLSTDISVIENFRGTNADLIEMEWFDGRLMQSGKIYEKTPGDTNYVIVSRLVPDEFAKNANNVRDVLQIYRTLDIVRSDLQRAFVVSFFIVYIPFLLIAVGSALYFSRKITRPIEELAAVTEKVREGDWNQRVTTKSKDELGKLVMSFNHMVANLKSNQKKLISLEKMAAWREIARVLAHEIKNPLTPIQLTAQQLRDKYGGSDPAYRKVLQECTEIIDDEVENLRTLVREFSDFARMPELKKEPSDINALLIDMEKLYQSQNIVLDLSKDVEPFLFDPEKMRRVFINLIDNAIAAGSSGADIKIRTSVHGNDITVAVSDQGSGIPPENVEIIFEPYFSTKHRGMGLGLAVVKKVIEEHGGSVRAQNRPGGGTSIIMEIPNP